MAFEQRANTGSLFRNDRKEKDTHPTHTGTAMIDGKEYYVSAWTKEGKNGRFFSMAFKPKMASEHRGGSANPPAQTHRDEFDSEIPF